jgi:hypothetical protein
MYNTYINNFGKLTDFVMETNKAMLNCWVSTANRSSEFDKRQSNRYKDYAEATDKAHSYSSNVASAIDDYAEVASATLKEITDTNIKAFKKFMCLLNQHNHENNMCEKSGTGIVKSK